MTGHKQLRVTFLGTASTMQGRCWCGRTYASADPKEIWSWLDEHGHRQETVEWPPAAAESRPTESRPAEGG